MLSKDTGILVVDDEEGMRDSLEVLLNDAGYQNVFTAADGRQGLERLSNPAIRIVVTDIRMPVIGGPEMLQTLKAAGRLPYYAVVIMSGYYDKKDADALDHVFEGQKYRIIDKPFNFDKLEKQLDEICATLT